MSGRFGRICLALLAWSSTAGGQQWPAQASLEEQLAIGPVYADTAGIVSVVVELPDGIAKPDPGNFMLSLDGEQVTAAAEVRSFRDAERGIAWMVCADVSGTMSGKPVKTMKAALHKFAAQLSGSDKLSLITFGSEIRLVSSFDDSREDFHRTLDRLRGREKRTRMYQGLLQALAILEQSRTAPDFPKRQIVVLIGDGHDNASTADAEAVVAKARTLHIPIEAVGWSKIDNQYLESLRDIAKRTGGTYVPAEPEGLRLEEALESLYRRLTQTQTVVAYFPYAQNAEGTQSKTVRLDLQLPGNLPLGQSIDESVPLAAPTPPPPATEQQVASPPPSPSVPEQPTWPIWILAGGLAALVTGLVLMVVGRKTGPEEDLVGLGEVSPGPPESAHFPSASDERVLQEGLPPPSQPAAIRRQTQIGTYFARPSARQPCAILEGRSAWVQGLEFAVEKAEVRIGANPGNDLSIPDDEFLSGQHACLRYEQGALIIVDLGSSNGTFVNDARISGTSGRLAPGDRIVVGSSVFVLRQV